MFDRSRVQALLHDEVDGEVLHRRIEELLHDPRQAMDLVDEEHVLLVQIAQNAEEIPAAIDRRRRSASVTSCEASDGRWPSCLTSTSHTSSRRPSASAVAGAAATGSAETPGRARANFATLAWSCATMFFAFCWPMPGSARRYFSSWRAIAAATSATGAASARAATIGPTSFTVMSFSKNSLSRSDVNPIRTGRG